jgi:hypothetical protein
MQLLASGRVNGRRLPFIIAIVLILDVAFGILKKKSNDKQIAPSNL